MTMCVKRAGLVWVLVLLTTTCFIFTCAAPTGANGKGSPANYRGPAKDDVITTTTAEPPTVSTTPPVKSIDEVDSSNNVMTDAPAVSDNLNEYVPSADQGYLYYEIKKRIYFECNLTLSDIQYVLSQKDEEGQFMFALADKLGYMSDGKHNDPHIPVIWSHREKLIELLEKMAAMKESNPPSQQEHNEGPTVSSDETPASKEPASPSDSKKIGYEVSTDIRGLGSDAIYDILSDLSFSDILGYVVGIQLGYSPKDEHMKYLENVDVEELKEFLQRILKSKTSNQITPDSSFDSRNGATPSGNSNGGEDPIKEGNGGVNNLQPSQKAKPSSKELVGDVQTTKAPSVSVKSKPGTLDSEERNSGGEYGDHKERPCDGCALYVMVKVDDFDMKGGGEDSNKLEAGGGDEPEAEEDYIQAVQRYWNADYGHVWQVTTPAAPPDDFLLLYQIDRDIRGYSYKDVNDILSYEDDTLPYALAEKLGQTSERSIRVIKENLKTIKGYLEREKEKKWPPDFDHRIMLRSVIVLLPIVLTLAMLYYCVFKTKNNKHKSKETNM